MDTSRRQKPPLRVFKLMAILLPLSGAAAAVAVGACGGKVVIDQREGAGGASSSSSSSSLSSPSGGEVGEAVSAGPSQVSASQGPGGPPPGPCLSCAEFLTNDGMGPLCPESKPIFDKLTFCVCAQSCVPQCSDNACSNGPITDACGQCMKKACQVEFDQCANDV